MKQLSLASKNYILFYIPSNELKATAENPVWSPNNVELELSFCDRPRSMLSMYTVNLMCRTTAYFMQQGLVVPGAESLELLKYVTYLFWDISIEVPTHVDALNPVLKQIQPAQLLRASQSENSTN